MKCIACGRSLKNKKSLLNNIGPVCQKNMRDFHLVHLGLDEPESEMVEELIDALTPVGLIYLKKLNFKHFPDHRYIELVNYITGSSSKINKRIEPLVNALICAYRFKVSGEDKYYNKALEHQKKFHRNETLFKKNNFGLIDTLEGVNFVDSILVDKSAKSA